jgi:hypothetical protein
MEKRNMAMKTMNLSKKLEDYQETMDISHEPQILSNLV